MSDALFRKLLGSEFQTLPESVKILHLAKGLRTYRGEVEVRRGRGLLSRLCAWATHLPSAGAGPVEVTIDADGAVERWVRRIGGRSMPSRLWEHAGLLYERLGLVRFVFRLAVHQGQLTWRVVRVQALGVPLPACAFSGVRAREWEHDGRYCFDVAARLPLAGMLVHYRGWLQVP